MTYISNTQIVENVKHRLWEPLTPKEEEVLILVAGGFRNTEIASKLGIRPQTVRTHISNIYGKTTAGNRVGLADLARALNLTPPSIDNTPVESLRIELERAKLHLERSLQILRRAQAN